jgi:hypothetical protein
VESSHRREWFEKLDRARENNPAASDDGEAGVTGNDVHEDEVVTIERGKCKFNRSLQFVDVFSYLPITY